MQAYTVFVTSELFVILYWDTVSCVAEEDDDVNVLILIILCMFDSSI